MQLKKAQFEEAWLPVVYAFRSSRFVTTVKSSRYGVSEANDGESSVMRPSAFGVQGTGFIPIGMYTYPRRRTDPATCAALADTAGIIASSNGRASVEPSPLKKVRLGNAILVTIIVSSASETVRS